jgi:hypothetical protein
MRAIADTFDCTFTGRPKVQLILKETTTNVVLFQHVEVRNEAHLPCGLLCPVIKCGLESITRRSYRVRPQSGLGQRVVKDETG